jgi:hypothetical protein
MLAWLSWLGLGLSLAGLWVGANWGLAGLVLGSAAGSLLGCIPSFVIAKRALARGYVG